MKKFFRRLSKKTTRNANASLTPTSQKQITVEDEFPNSSNNPNEPPKDNEEQEPWSDANFDRMAQQWKLTKEQQEKMLDLKQRLKDVKHWKNDPFEVVRFLRELQWNVKQTEDKFRKMVQWRVENNIDSKLQDYGEPHPVFDYFPSVVLKGVDKDGDPIFVERPGAFDCYGFYREFGSQKLADFIIYHREKYLTRQPDQWQTQYYEPTYGKRVGRFTVIMDVQGLNRNHMRAGLLPLLHVLARITQDYYAGVAKRIIILRAPSIFKLFWSLVKGFFDPCIRELITITTQADYMDVLDLYMDREVLPSQVWEDGRGEYMPGFENVMLDGGALSQTLLDTYQGKSGEFKSSGSFSTEATDTSNPSFCEDTDDESVQTTLTEGVNVVSAGLIGGGTFRGQAIYLR